MNSNISSVTFEEEQLKALKKFKSTRESQLNDSIAKLKSKELQLLSMRTALREEFIEKKKNEQKKKKNILKSTFFVELCIFITAIMYVLIYKSDSIFLSYEFKEVFQQAIILVAVAVGIIGVVVAFVPISQTSIIEGEIEEINNALEKLDDEIKQLEVDSADEISKFNNAVKMSIAQHKCKCEESQKLTDELNKDGYKLLPPEYYSQQKSLASQFETNKNVKLSSEIKLMTEKKREQSQKHKQEASKQVNAISKKFRISALVISTVVTLSIFLVTLIVLMVDAGTSFLNDDDFCTVALILLPFTFLIIWGFVYLYKLNTSTQINELKDVITKCDSSCTEEILKNKSHMEKEVKEEISRNAAKTNTKIELYHAAFESAAETLSKQYATSQLATTVISWISEHFWNTIKATSRATHVLNISVPYTFNIYKDKIISLQGTFDFTQKRCQILTDGIDQAALARGIASNVRTVIITKNLSTPIDQNCDIEIEYEYNGSCVNVKMEYKAINGNYTEARTWI